VADGIEPRHDGTGRPALTAAFADVGEGRRIAYSELGDSAGRPVIYAHGFPSSRREALLLHESAVAAGARIITSDRPGYGDSDDAPRRQLSDWPDDVLRLADHLRLGRFAVLGVSGGGPYALACAWRIPAVDPGRMAGCAMVCPLGPLYIPELLRAMNWAVRANLAIGKQPAWIADLLFGRYTTAVLHRWPALVEKVRHIAAPPADQKVLGEGDNAAVLNATIADAMRDRAQGARRDLVLYTHDWKLPFAEVTDPVTIWHGQADGTVPIKHARWYAEHLSQARLNELPDEGHYSVPLLYSRRILDELLVGFAEDQSATH